MGFCDLIPQKAQYLADRFKIKTPIYERIEKMLDEVSPDAVIICTPDFAHVNPTITALKRNIHVFCEKPMATTLKDCDTMVNAAKKSSAIFYLGFNLRHGPIHETVHEIVSSGRLGKISTIEANENYYGGKTYFRRWNRFVKYGGGLWLTKACHDFDLLNWIAGAEPQTVYATSNLSHYHSNPGAAKQCRNCKLQFQCPDFYDAFSNDEEERIFREIRLIGEQHGSEPSDLCLYTSEKDTFDNGIAVVTYKNDIRTTYTVNVIAARDTRMMRVVGTEGTCEADMGKGVIEVTERHSRRSFTYDLRQMMSSGHGGGTIE